MNIPERLYKNFVSTENIVCIISEEEHKIFIRNEFITKSDNLVAISVHEEDNVGIPDELLSNTYDNYLKVAFWDLPQAVYFDEENNKSYYGLNDEIAKEIVLFIMDNINENFVINCAAGVSRSAAIGMAILAIKLFDGNLYEFQTCYKNPIMEHWRYKPNKYVFSKLIETYKVLSYL